MVLFLRGWLLGRFDKIVCLRSNSEIQNKVYFGFLRLVSRMFKYHGAQIQTFLAHIWLFDFV